MFARAAVPPAQAFPAKRQKYKAYFVDTAENQAARPESVDKTRERCL
jgi:hypothetical protein